MWDREVNEKYSSQLKSYHVNGLEQDTEVPAAAEEPPSGEYSKQMHGDSFLWLCMY